MAIFKAKQVADRLPIPSANGGTDVIPIVGDWTVAATTPALASGDIIELAGLPFGYVIVDAIVDHDNLGTAFTGALGLMSGEYQTGGARTCGTELMDAATFQAAAVKRVTKPLALRLPPATDATVAAGGPKDRSVGLVISGTLTAPVIGAKLRLTLLVRPQSEGV